MNLTTKIAILGSGGREHAIAWKLAQDIGADAIFVLPGNPAIPNSYDIDIANFKAIKSFCESHDIQRIFVGPEQPLANGIVDYFLESDILVLGPDAASAKLESSKIFSKEFMQKYGVATAAFRKFKRIQDAYGLLAQKKEFVIKLDGLAAGKGVFVCDTEAEGMEALQTLTQKYGQDVAFIIEDKIIGDEISIIGFTDGKNIQLLQPSQDHKQLLNGDKGPNTGGMGAYCPIPRWNDSHMQTIHKNIIQPTLKGIQAEGMNYHGIIYFGIMISEDGPLLLEYNVRLGDPETEVLLPSLKSSLAELLEATLFERLANYNISFNKGYFVDVVLASNGYPNNYPKGLPITIQEMGDDDLIFYAGVDKTEDKLVTNGGRVLNVIGKGMNLESAIQDAYSQVSKVHFPDMYFRKDIGQRKNRFLNSKPNQA